MNAVPATGVEVDGENVMELAFAGSTLMLLTVKGLFLMVAVMNRFGVGLVVLKKLNDSEARAPLEKTYEGV